VNQPSFRKRWLTTAIAVAACSAPTAVLAQDAEQRASSGSGSSTELPTLQVTESRIYEEATGPVEGYVATRTATGTKTDTPINEVPQSISVITRDEVEARGAQSIGDVLSYTAGVEGHANGLDPRRDVISIRGFGGTEYFYRDGLNRPGYSGDRFV
jgi:iron complex outermembrane recepter protein